MDIILIAIVSLSFMRGWSKGLGAILLSLVSTIVSIYISIWITDMVSVYVVDLVGENILEMISKCVDRVVGGSFSSIGELKEAISQCGLPFIRIINKILDAISFEGELSASQILASSITNVLIKIFCFIIAFFVVNLVFNFIKVLGGKLINCCGLGVANKLIGGIVGSIKGLIVFLLLFAILIEIADLLMNKTFQNFLNDAVVSKWVYDCVSNLLRTSLFV